jgi:hypothetical protein
VELAGDVEGTGDGCGVQIFGDARVAGDAFPEGGMEFSAGRMQIVRTDFNFEIGDLRWKAGGEWARPVPRSGQAFLRQDKQECLCRALSLRCGVSDERVQIHH